MNFDNSLPYTMNENGTATSPSDYLEKIKNFLTNMAGFTIFSSSTDFYCLEKESVFYTFRTNSGTYNSIDFYTAETGQTSFSNTINREVITLTQNFIESYNIYYNGRNIIIVTEYEVGFYNFVSGGKQTNIGDTDNIYYCGSIQTNSSSSQPNLETYRAFTTENNNMYIDSFLTTSFREGFEILFIDNFVYNSRIKLNEKGLLFSNILTINGEVPIFEYSDFFFSGVEYYATEEVFSIGSKVFKFYPNYEKVIPRQYNQKTKAVGLCVRTA